MSKREKLARALHVRYCQLIDIDPDPWEDLAGSTQIFWLEMSDAAKAELREPTPEMCSASGMGAGPTAKLTATAVWQAMIDAIGDET